MQETMYRGYRVRYHKVAEWFAHIYRPGASSMMSEKPKATVQEGEALLMVRVRAIIDREEEARQAKEKSNKGD